MKKCKKIAVVITLVFIISVLTGCSNSQEGDLKTKVISELDYINTKTISMLNKLNNISFESYSIISEQVEFSNEEKQQQNQSGGKSSQTASGTEEGGSGSSSNTSGEESQQTEQSNSSDKINTTDMVMNVELEKDRNNIDWTTIKNEIELLDESWAIITLDLYTLNVENNMILDFSNKLNTAMVAIKNEDKQKSLASLADLYSSIPKFLQKINADKNLQRIRQTQSYVINAYILADDIGNAEISNNLTQAIITYSEVMSDIDYTKNKTEKTNKVYVLLNELQNSLSEKDSDIFYIKYKNFMKEIEAI